MEKRIREIINENSGVTGVIVRDSFGKKIMINEEVIFPSASIIKLFILMALNKDEYNKKIELKKEDKVGGCGILKVMEDGLPLTIKDVAYLIINKQLMMQPLIIENGKTVFIIKYEKLKYIGINKEIIIGKRGVI